MVHFFILFPLLIILGASLVQLVRRYPDDITFRYFRNSILMWSVYMLGVGGAETFSGKTPVVFTTLSIVLVFFYIASSYIVRIPFAITRKEGSWSKFLSALIIGLGIFLGLSLFLMEQNLQASTGPLAGLFAYMSGQFSTAFALSRVLVYHMIVILVIFVPVGTFFFFEASRAIEARNRIRSILVGIGLIIAVNAEWYHVAGLHNANANRDLLLIFGFLLIVVGLFYPTWKPTARPVV